MKKQEFIELLKNAKTDEKGNLYYIGKEYCGKRVYFATVNTICDDFVEEYCCDENDECYHYNRHFTNNDDTIEIQIVKDEAEKPRTNFDKITESVENFVQWIYSQYGGSPPDMPCKETGCENPNCKECFKEWLQKEDEA